MPIEYRAADLLAADEPVVAHGCNARGRFGAGFAGAVARRAPGVRDKYLRDHARGWLRLGGISWAINGGRLFANCITQATHDGWPRTGGLFLDYGALASCMRVLDRAGRDGIPGTAFAGGFDRVALPTIGAGNAGGEWDRISEIVERELTHVRPVVYALPGALPTWWPGDSRAPTLDL